MLTVSSVLQDEPIQPECFHTNGKEMIYLLTVLHSHVLTYTPINKEFISHASYSTLTGELGQFISGGM